jgi:hypothetical protein
MSKKWPQSETELAKVVIAYLRELQWEIYMEVSMGSGVADIVAVQGKLIWIVECKRSFTLDVLSQAYRWRKQAHWVSVAIPMRYHIDPLGIRIMESFGIGCLEARDTGMVTERIEPFMNRKAHVQITRERLFDEQKTFCEAGTSKGGYFTPFKSTCRRIAQYVKENPGCTLVSLVANIKTHYATPASARACIANLGAQGIIPGIRLEKDGKAIRAYPDSVVDGNAGIP